MNNFSLIKSLVSIVQVASYYGLQFEKSNKTKCLWHDDKNPSLSIDKSGEFVYCFGCKVAMDVIELEFKLGEHTNRWEAIKALNERYNLKLDLKGQNRQLSEKHIHLNKLLQFYCNWTHNILLKNNDVIKWLHDTKGITTEDIKRYKIGYTCNGWLAHKISKDDKELALQVGLLNQKDGRCFDYFRNRIIFPIYIHGKIKSIWSRRYPDDEGYGAKWLGLRNSELIKYKPIPYAENLNSEICLIPESLPDSITLLKNGFPSVCLLGSEISKHNKELFINSKAELYFCLDPDEPGRRAAYKLAREYKGYVLDLGYDKDPDEIYKELGKDGFNSLVEASIDKAKYYLDLVLEKEPLQESLRVISKLNLESDKDVYLKKLYELNKKDGITLNSIRKDLKIIEKKSAEDLNTNDIEIQSINPLDEFTDEEINNAKELLKDEYLFEKIIKNIATAGYIGEEINKQVLYLAFTSRLLDEAISCVIKGDSSSGKSSLVKAVLSLFPESSYKEFTSISPQSLYYMKELDLSHTILVIFEAHGSEKADYPIRSSISEGELRLLVTQKNQNTGNFESREILIPAKGLSYVETTTKSKINPENQTRLFDLYTDCSEQQTKNILLAKSKIVDKEEVESQNRIFKALQLLLEPYEVFIPFSEFLADSFPTKKVRARRDFIRFQNLIKSICILYQYQRERIIKFGKENLLASLQDYEIVYNIANVVLSQTLKEITPKQETILKSIKKHLAEEEFSIADLKQLEKLKEIADSTLRGEVKKLTFAGYLEWNGEKAKKSRYKFIDTPKDYLKLPTPEEVSIVFPSLIAQCTNNQELQGVTVQNRAIAQSSSIAQSNEYKAIKLI